MGLEFRNGLNIPVDIYFYYEVENNKQLRGAGNITLGDVHESYVEGNGGTLHMDTDGLSNEFQLQIKIPQTNLPEGNNAKGFKLDPGNDIGYTQNIQFIQKEDHLLLVILYKDPLRGRSKDAMSHIDPQVDFPD